MKNLPKILIVLLAWVIALPAIAQIGVGVRVGGNLAKVAVTDEDGESVDEDVNYSFGLVGGGLIELSISDKFAIQPELLYSQHGFAVDMTFFDEEFSVKTRFNYLQVPILAKIKFGSEPVGFHVMAGPYAGYGVGDITVSTEMDGEKEEETASWEDTELKRVDFGVAAGLGVSISAGPGRIGLDARYQLGLANMIEEPSGSEKLSNRNLQFSLCYIIPLGK